VIVFQVVNTDVVGNQIQLLVLMVVLMPVILYVMKEVVLAVNVGVPVVDLIVLQIAVNQEVGRIHLKLVQEVVAKVTRKNLQKVAVP
jgi:hypothetical protein